MTLDEWFETHKTVSDFADGEVIHLFVDGIGEVVTKYSVSGSDLRDIETNESYGSLSWWLKTKAGMNSILCPPNLGEESNT